MTCAICASLKERYAMVCEKDMANLQLRWAIGTRESSVLVKCTGRLYRIVREEGVLNSSLNVILQMAFELVPARSRGLDEPYMKGSLLTEKSMTMMHL